jgi:hypothetical protein
MWFKRKIFMKKSLIVLCLISGIAVSAQTDFKNLSNKKGIDLR